jgi:ABC-type dipeptide/oligopeptide/nickel transport system permease subunit
VILLALCAVAFVGPLISPHPLATPIGIPGTGPNSQAPLGTDFLGRDVLSRLLHGGAPVITLSVLSILLTYVVGVSVGMVAALARPLVGSLLMRTVDLFLVFPPLLLLLVLIAGTGTGTAVVLIGTALVLFPGVARIVYTATLEVSTTSYLEAAIARGEGTLALMQREIFPNILPILLADLGVRFSGAIILVASLNFLGLGAQPPSANWALMISENREIITSNVWAVLAPAIMLGLLTVGANLVGDAYVHALDRSGEES